MAQMNQSTRQKQDSQRWGTDLWLLSGMDWRCKLLHLEWIRNEVLMYSTGNYILTLGIEHDGK